MYKLNDNIKVEHITDRLMMFVQRRLGQDKNRPLKPKAEARDAKEPEYAQYSDQNMDEYTQAGSLAFYAVMETLKSGYLFPVLFS